MQTSRILPHPLTFVHKKIAQPIISPDKRMRSELKKNISLIGAVIISTVLNFLKPGKNEM